MITALWSANIMLAVGFLAAGATKILRSRSALHALGMTFVQDFSTPAVKVLGIAEVGGGARPRAAARHRGLPGPDPARRSRAVRPHGRGVGVPRTPGREPGDIGGARGRFGGKRRGRFPRRDAVRAVTPVA